MTSSAHDRLREELAAAGLPPGSAVAWSSPAPDSPPPPEGPWVIVPHEGWAVGGVSRGAFRPYAITDALEDAIALAVDLLGPPRYPPVQRGMDVPERGRSTARGIVSRAMERGGQAGPADLEPGDVLDVLGSLTGHHVFAWGTPFAHRSQPPPMATAASYHQFEVRSALTLATEGLVGPWFEQPGGGPMVVLGHPIRWHLDHGELVELIDV